MACQHSLELEDFYRNFVYRRELVQLRGWVTNKCQEEFVKVKILESGQTIKTQVKNKIFKLLIRLCPGDNALELQYCDATLAISIKYEPISPTEDKVRDVQPIYILYENSDGHFQAPEDGSAKNDVTRALQKIDVAMQLAQCVISTKLNESSFGERSFILRNCKVFQSSMDVAEARSLNQLELYEATAKEIILTEGVDAIKYRKFVAFLSCTKFEGLQDGEQYSYANINRKLSGNAALGGSFLCVIGSGCFYAWPNRIKEVPDAFMNRTVVDITKVLDDSNYRRTWGGCFATSLGTLIHELCHTFDLAHTKTGLMGTDIDYTHRFFLAQSFTDNLPSRTLSNCSVQKQTSDSAPRQVFTKIKKPGAFLDKYHEQKNNDMTFFEENCLIALWNHQWFSHVPCQGNPPLLTFCVEEKTLKSPKSPIQLVELRELEKNNSIVIKYWRLDDLAFTIPPDTVLKNVSLFAISSSGEVFKTDF